MDQRVDKLLSREFLSGLIGVVVLSLAYFAKDGIDFSDFALWLMIALGVPTGALTVQKAVGSITKGAPPGGQP